MSLADYLELRVLALRYSAHAGDVWQLEHLADRYGVGRVREWLVAGVLEPLPAVATHIGRFDVLDVLLGAGCPTSSLLLAARNEGRRRAYLALIASADRYGLNWAPWR